MGKGSKKGGKATKGKEMDWEAEGASIPGEGSAVLSAKEKQRQKMASKRALKVQITELKKTRAKIGKARDKRMDRRAVTNQLKELKAKNSVAGEQGEKGETDDAGGDDGMQH